MLLFLCLFDNLSNTEFSAAPSVHCECVKYMNILQIRQKRCKWLVKKNIAPLANISYYVIVSPFYSFDMDAYTSMKENIPQAFPSIMWRIWSSKTYFSPHEPSEILISSRPRVTALIALMDIQLFVIAYMYILLITIWFHYDWVVAFYKV